MLLSPYFLYSDFGDNLVRALPDIIGSTIGNAIAGAVRAPQAHPVQSETATQSWGVGPLPDTGPLSTDIPQGPYDAVAAIVQLGALGAQIQGIGTGLPAGFGTRITTGGSGATGSYSTTRPVSQAAMQPTFGAQSLLAGAGLVNYNIPSQDLFGLTKTAFAPDPTGANDVIVTAQRPRGLFGDVVHLVTDLATGKGAFSSDVASVARDLRRGFGNFVAPESGSFYARALHQEAGVATPQLRRQQAELQAYTDQIAIENSYLALPVVAAVAVPLIVAAPAAAAWILANPGTVYGIAGGLGEGIGGPGAFGATGATGAIAFGGANFLTEGDQAVGVLPQAGPIVAAEGAAPLSQIEINAQNGAAFQARVSAYGGDTLSNFVEELSIKPNTANGPADFRIRLDGFGTDPNTNGFAGLEAKASETAPLTQNQTPGFDLLKNFGGTVVGKAGGAVYPTGTPIPPTGVQIIRPSNLPPGY